MAFPHFDPVFQKCLFDCVLMLYTIPSSHMSMCSCRYQVLLNPYEKNLCTAANIRKDEVVDVYVYGVKWLKDFEFLLNLLCKGPQTFSFNKHKEEDITWMVYRAQHLYTRLKFPLFTS